MYAVLVRSGIFIFISYMIMLLTSHQYAHLRRQHLQVRWDDLKIELLRDEDAAKVRDRSAEALAHKRAQRSYDGLYCAHCKMAGDSVTLAEHVNKAYVFSFLLKVLAVNKFKIYSHKILEVTDKDIVPALDRAPFPLEHWLWPPRPVTLSLPATVI